MENIGNDVIAAFRSDIEAFFDGAAGFELRIERGGIVPTCKGTGSKARVCIPAEFFTQPVQDTETLVFYLLVLGHETAHYLHRHNEHYDESALDSKAIEMWADFFGTKVAFVVWLFGAELSKFLAFNPKNQMERVDVFSSALSRLWRAYFQTANSKYPGGSARFATCVAGLMSFFEQYFKWDAADTGDLYAYANAQNPASIVKRALVTQMRIYANSSIKSCNLLSVAGDLDTAQIELISDIHRRIQGEQSALFAGMKPLPAVWLRLDYSISASEQKRIAAQKATLLKNTLISLGLDPIT